MSEALKVVYEGIEITYFEAENLWKFELRGRDRSAESLAKAKEFIDKPAPESKKVFKRIPAIHLSHYDNTPDSGEITAIAEARQYTSRQEVWFVSNNNNRRKQEASEMFIVNESNQDKLTKIAANNAKVERLNDASYELYEQLEKVDLSGCE